LAALQLALPYATELPPDSVLAPRHARATKPPALGAFPELAKNNVFDPARQKGGSSASAGDSDAGLTAIGAVSSGRGSAALMRTSGGAARFLRPGASIGGWTLISIEPDAVWLRKGDVKRRLAFGATPRPSPPAEGGTPAPQPGDTP
jgi:hypothetical protein